MVSSAIRSVYVSTNITRLLNNISRRYSKRTTIIENIGLSLAYTLVHMVSAN